MQQEKTGQYIAELRREKNWTQEQLATRLGVSNRSVSRWENGRSMPDLSLLQTLAEELGTSVPECLNGHRMTPQELTVMRHAIDEVLNDAPTEKQAWADSQRNQIAIEILCMLILILDAKLHILSFVFQDIPVMLLRSALYGIVLTVTMIRFFQDRGMPIGCYKDLLLKKYFGKCKANKS